MIIRRPSALVWTAALQLVVLSGVAAAQPTVRYGPFAPNVSISDAVAAQPDMGWQTIRNRATNKIVKVVAEHPLQFANLDWRLSLGEDVGGGPLAYVYSFDLRSKPAAESVRACRLQFSQVISTLEAMYGVFGRHPAFSRDNKGVSAPLYSDLRAFKIRPVGDRSVLRDYGDGGYTTFLEVDEATGEAVMAEATFIPAHRACALRIHAFQDNDRIHRAQVSRVRTQKPDDRRP